MSRPKYYPWTARLASSKKDAGEAAKLAGKKKVEGEREYTSYADHRANMQDLTLRRMSSSSCAESFPSARMKDLLSTIKNDEITVELGLPFLRRLTTRQPIRTWSGYGYKTVGYNVSYKEYKKVKAEYTPKKRNTHKEVVTCPSCDGYGLGDIRSYRDGSTHQARCRKCGGSGRILRKVSGKGPDQEIKWDGTLTSTWVSNGDIDKEEAEKIREKCRMRHEETNYDLLLKKGMSKEDARAFCLKR